LANLDVFSIEGDMRRVISYILYNSSTKYNTTSNKFCMTSLIYTTVVVTIFDLLFILFIIDDFSGSVN
jgi:hypothetical protein